MDKTKNILVLGAGSLQVPLIQKVIEKGFNPIVISLHEDEPGMLIAKEKVIGDFCDEQFTLEVAKKYNVCAVITDQTDIPVRTAAYVAEELNLPGIGYKTAVLFTDKYKMRERCKDIGVKTIDYKLCNNLDEVKDFYNYLNTNIILKPINNQGSKGVYKVSTPEELEAKYNDAIKYSRGHAILAERFIKGEEVVIEAITINGKTTNLICGDTYYFNIEDAFSAKQRRFPSLKDSTTIQKALDLNISIIQGFGLQNGITHGEYIIDGNEIYLIEIAARGGGVYISSDIIPLMTNFDTCSYLIDFATRNNTKIQITDTQKHVCYLAFYVPEGIIVDIDGIDIIKQLPYIHHNNLDTLYVGKKNGNISDKTTRYFIVLEAKNQEELSYRINYIKQNLRIETQTENEKRPIIWE